MNLHRVAVTGFLVMCVVSALNPGAWATPITIQFEPGITGTITESGWRPNIGGYPHFGDIRYVESGLTVYAITGVFHFYGSPSPIGGSALTPFTLDGAFIEFSFGGAPFDVLSLDRVFGWYGVLTSSLGATQGGPDFWPPPDYPGWQTFDFTRVPGWSGITWFTLMVPGPGDNPVGIDNLVIQPSAVPEASSLTLLGTGLVVSISYRCRRRRR